MSQTRRECLKLALYLRLKKRKVFTILKGDHFGFLKIQFVAKYPVASGDSLVTLKKFENLLKTFSEKKEK